MLAERMGGNTVKLKPNEEVMKNLRTTLANKFDPETGPIPWRKREWQEVEVRNEFSGKKEKRFKRVIVEDAAAKERALNAQTRVLINLDEHAKTQPATVTGDCTNRTPADW